MSNESGDVAALARSSLVGLHGALAGAARREDDVMIAATITLDVPSQLSECHRLIAAHPALSVAQRGSVGDVLLDVADLLDEPLTIENAADFVRAHIRLSQAAYAVMMPLFGQEADEPTWKAIRGEFELTDGPYIGWRTRGA